MSSLVQKIIELNSKKILGVSRGEELTLSIEGGAWIEASYWRLLSPEHAPFSSFDDGQVYGNASPLDALAILTEKILNAKIEAAVFNNLSGDIELELSDGSTLQIFNFSSFEVWEIGFGDGSGEFSNYALNR